MFLCGRLLGMGVALAVPRNSNVFGILSSRALFSFPFLKFLGILATSCHPCNNYCSVHPQLVQKPWAMNFLHQPGHSAHLHQHILIPWLYSCMPLLWGISKKTSTSSLLKINPIGCSKKLKLYKWHNLLNDHHPISFVESFMGAQPYLLYRPQIVHALFGTLIHFFALCFTILRSLVISFKYVKWVRPHSVIQNFLLCFQDVQGCYQLPL